MESIAEAVTPTVIASVTNASKACCLPSICVNFLVGTIIEIVMIAGEDVESVAGAEVLDEIGYGPNGTATAVSR